MGIDYSRITYLLDAACRDPSRMEDLASAMVQAGVDIPPGAISPQGQLEFVQQAREWYQDYLFSRAKSGDTAAFDELIGLMWEEIAKKSRKLRAVQRGHMVDAYTRSEFVQSVMRRALVHYRKGMLQLMSLGEVQAFLTKTSNNLVQEKRRRESTRNRHEADLKKHVAARLVVDPSSESAEAIFHVVRDTIPHRDAQDLLTEMAVRWNQRAHRTEQDRFELPSGRSQYLKHEYIVPVLDHHQNPR